VVPKILNHLKTQFADARAGLSTALIGVPQEINYGLLAFAPLGLVFVAPGIAAAFFGSALAVLLYTLLGAGRGQVIGPRPTLSVLLAGLFLALQARDVPVESLPVAAVIVMLLTGVLLIAAARSGVGHLFKYIPLPVLAGFTNGVAVLLALSVLPMMLGLGINVSAGLSWQAVHWPSVVITVATVWVSLRPCRLGFFRQVPALLQAIAIASALHALTVVIAVIPAGPVVGDILPRMPDPMALLQTLRWPDFAWGDWLVMSKFALALAVVAALETLAVTGAVDAQLNQRTPSDPVVQRLGMAYLVFAPLMMPVGGSLGRSVALLSTGAASRGANVYYALFLIGLITLAFPLVAQLPQAAIAGVLIVVARSMVGNSIHQSISELRAATERSDRLRSVGDLGVMLVVALITITYSFIAGLALGIIAAMVLFIRDQSRATVRRVQFGDLCRSLRVRSAEARRLQASHGKEIVIIEAEGTLFFGSAEDLVERLDLAAKTARELILDLRRVSDIDLTASRLLRQAARRYREQQCQLLISHLPAGRRLHRQMLARGLAVDVPVGVWFADLDSALEYAESRLLRRHGLADAAMQAVALADSDLARGMAPAEVALLASYLRPCQLMAGELLFRQGDAGTSLFVICRGALSIHLPQQAESSKRLIAFGPGAVLGEMALITGAPRSANALADEDSELLELDAAAFERLERERPEIAITLLRILAALLADRLRTTTGQLRELID
jgi:sulfate permease, SulP family